MGTTVVTWSYDDGNGNISTQDQNITLNGIDNSVTQNGNTITANSVGSTYQWLDCDNGNTPIAGATSADYTATTNGSFAVEITNGSCVDSSVCTTIAGIGFDEIENDLGFRIYPNPSQGLVTLELNGLSNSVLTIYSLDGKIIINNMPITDMINEISLIGVESGVYLVSLSNDSSQKTVRLIIE